MKYAYAAIFTPEIDGKYSIDFPDLEGCYTCGDSIPDGISMAEDVLALVLYNYEVDGREIPVPTKPGKIKCNDNEFVTYIQADTMEYRKRFNNKAVKKTLTIPEWMNEAATAANLNFSQVLQEAILNKLNIA